jgi:hypothetical protein
MIIKNSQQDITINFVNTNAIAMKMSGGADSAIMAYMVAKYINEENKDLKMYPVTVDHPGKDYQINFASKVINYINTKFDDEIFLQHQTGLAESAQDYTPSMDKIVNGLYKEGKIQGHFVGITKNPPPDAFDEAGTNLPTGFDRSFDKVKPTYLEYSMNRHAYMPLVNIDKKGIAELYHTLNVMDLFSITRSCEDFTTDFTTHCTSCWWCKERYWGFDTYE